MKLCLAAHLCAPVLAVALAVGPAASDARSSINADLRVTELRMPLITRLPVPDFTAVLPATAQTDGLTEEWLMAAARTVTPIGSA
jgi:hypothetical protein